MSVSPLLNFSEAFASSLAVTSTRRPQGSATVADSERAQANNPVSAAAPESLIESEQLDVYKRQEYGGARTCV